MKNPVADLEGALGAIAPHGEENFSIFPSRKDRKTTFHYLGGASKSDFYL
jgi:hypothetical protein